MDLDLGRHSVAEWAEAAPDGEADTFQPAQQKYAIGAPIGKGGMGEVFLATDRDLRRQVAMKLLRKDVGGGRDQLLHFVAEAQATSQLEHPACISSPKRKRPRNWSTPASRRSTTSGPPATDGPGSR